MLPEIPPITAYTPQGKTLVAALRVLLRGVHFWRGKAFQRPPPYFHEDPRLFTRSDLLFFAYKYYFRPTLESDEKATVEDFFEQNPPVFQAQSNITTEVTLTAAGDLMPYEWIQKRFCPHLWDDIADDFFSSDLTFANLETPIDITQPASLVPEVMLSDMNFNADEEMFALFQATDNKHQATKRQGAGDRGFDILSTANNHSLDMGEQGIFKTIEYLENKKIAFTGTARTPEERANFPIIEKNGIKIAFIAYTFSMNQHTNPDDKPFLVNHLEVNQPNIDLSLLKNDVALARARGAEFVILSLHFSNAYQAYPNAHIVKNAQRIFDECGVDIILGGHAHNIQPMARYDFMCPFTQQKKAGLVLFAFSDFIAYDIFNGCHLSVYLKLKIGKNTEGGVFLTAVEAVPVYACGVYHNKNKRDLRLLDAKKWLSKIENEGKRGFMTDWNVKELKALMTFYNDYFGKNLTHKV